MVYGVRGGPTRLQFSPLSTLVILVESSLIKVIITQEGLERSRQISFALKEHWSAKGFPQSCLCGLRDFDRQLFG